MFLPRSKYQIKQATWGQFVLSGSHGSYVGPYIEDYLGRTYAGNTLEGAENRVLYRVNEVETIKATTKKMELVPTEKDYQKGDFTRYFRRHRTSKIIEEVDRKTFQDSNDQIWQKVSCLWRVKGNLEDQLIYNYVWHGLRWRNQKTLNALEREMPGIVEVLELEPDEFVVEKS